jgi:hypothetical protein
MTRRTKTLIAAAALLVLMIGGYLGARAYQTAQRANPPPVNTAFTERIKLSDSPSDTIVGIAISSTGVRLEKRGDLWETVPPSSIELDQSAIQSVLWSLSSLYAERVIDEAPEDLSVYGLDTPRSHTVITDSGGKVTGFFGGNRTPSGSGYYVMLEGDPKVYSVASYYGDRLYLTMPDIRNKTLTSGFEIGELRRFLLETGDSRIEVVPASAQPGMISELFPHVLISPYVIPREVDSERFSPLWDAFQNIQIREFVDDDPPSLEPYGLDKPARVSIETESASFEILLGNTAENRQYAKLPGERGVFAIDDLNSTVLVTPFSLAGKFAFIINIDKVDSLTVRGNGRPLDAEIRRQGQGDDKEETYFLNGRQAVEKDFKAFYQALIGLLVDAEHPDHPTRGGNEEITIEYTLNNPAGTKAAVKLIPYNRDFYALDRDGVVEFLVSRPQAAAIYQAADKMTYVE